MCKVFALAAVSWQCGQAAVSGGETTGDSGSTEDQTGVAQLRKVIAHLKSRHPSCVLESVLQLAISTPS